MSGFMNKLVLGLQKIRVSFMGNSAYVSYLRKQGVIIGDGCSISKSAYFGSEPFLVKIGDHVRITQNVKFITHDEGLWTLRHMGLIPSEAVKYGDIRIGDNCNISWNVIIMPNVHIGNNCVIAAGAVVTKNVPDGEVWGGVPARFIETIDEYHKKIFLSTVPTFGMRQKEKEEYLRENKPELFENSAV